MAVTVQSVHELFAPEPVSKSEARKAGKHGRSTKARKPSAKR